MPPAHAVAGAAIVAAGGGVTATLVLELLVHELLVTLTARTTLPEAGAVKVIELVPWPLAIVPLVMVQLYDAPAMVATLADAFAFAQTEAGAAIVALGVGLIATDAVALPLQDAELVTVTPRLTVPLAAAVKMIVFVPWPLLIVPPEIVQLNDAPATAAVLALVVAFAQTVDGAVINGVTALMATFALPVPVHAPDVTLTPRTTLPLAPALKVIAELPAPAVMVPPLIVQL